MTAEPTTLEADLCIVGGGAAGLTLAHALRESGLKILLLESGGETLDLSIQDLNDGVVAPGERHAPPNLYRQRRLGGATTIWGGRCVPYEPIDFEARPGLHDGWPIPYEEVARFYPEAMRYCEAGEDSFTPDALLQSRPWLRGVTLPDAIETNLERFSMPTDFGRRWARELASASNIRIQLRATVLRIEKEADGRTVSQVVFTTPDGQVQAVKARAFVVAAGGLETARLLMASGLCQTSGALGRHYMCHLEGTLGELRLTGRDGKAVYGFERTRDGVYARRRLTLPAETKRRLGLMNLIVRLHHATVVDPAHRNGVLSSMYMVKQFIIPEYRRKLSMVEHAASDALPQGPAFWLAHLRNLVLDAPRTATFAADWTVRRYMMQRRIPYVVLESRTGSYPLDFNAEQTPDTESRVELAADTDRYGVPKLQVRWRAAEADIRSIAATYREMRRVLDGAAGVELAFDDAQLEDDLAREAMPVGGHHIGLARMSGAPETGVVDTDCRTHDLGNLYLCGAATFPTSSHANPTLTIVAMALRLAETLGRTLGRQTA